MTSSNTLGWQEIRTSGYVLPLLIMCCGIFIYGTDYAFGATIMPIVVQEIGGARLINWVVSIFELGAILSAVSVPILVKRFTLQHIINTAIALYILSCVAIAMAPNMEVIIAARFTQGMGGGVFISLALIVVSTIFPKAYFMRMMAVVSAVWGSASFSGPLIGSVFAELGIWRGGFVFMAVLAVGVAVGYNFILMPFLRARHGDSLELSGDGERLPKIRLGVLALSIFCFAAAGIARENLLTVALLVAGGLLFAYMIRRDKTAEVNILPQSVFTNTPSGCGLMVALLAPMGAIAISTYGPIFMTLQFATSPIVNGYVIVLISISWSASAFFVGHLPQHYATTLMRCGMIAVAISQIGMGLGFYTGNFALIPLFAPVEGVGFGMCWSFIAQRTIRLAPPADRIRISTSMFTMQRVGFSMGSALLGVVVNNIGFSAAVTAEALRVIGFVTLVAPVPLILVAVVFAWRLAKVPLPDE